jgi:hypothetical protein
MVIEVLPITDAIAEMLTEIGVPLSVDVYAEAEEWAATLPWPEPTEG